MACLLAVLWTILLSFGIQRVRVNSVAFGADGLLFSESWDKTVKIWNSTTGECLRTLTGHTDSVSSVAFGADNFLASGSNGKTVMLWDSKTGDCLRTLIGHTERVNSVDFDADGLFSSGASDRGIRSRFSDSNLIIWKKEY